MNRKLLTGSLVGLLGIAAVGILFVTESNQTADAQDQLTPTITQNNGKTIKTFELVAKETNWKLNDQAEVAAWTYNGSVPGSQIRVTEGDIVRVHFTNQLPELTSIHWHGYPVPSTMDGVPGVSQNSLRPGESFTYEFEAKVPGTYWYHSHQSSAEQVDRGLYGTLVVEGKNEPKADRDYTVVLDEWNPAAASTGKSMDHDGMNMNGMDHGSMNMSGMDHGSMNMSGMNHGDMQMSHEQMMQNTDHLTSPGAMHDEMMKQMYSIFTVNGKSGKAIEPLRAEQGEQIRLRFVNAGFQSHILHLQGQAYKIVSTDGQPIESPPVIQDQPFTIAPGERYDIEFTQNSATSWFIESYDDNQAASGMRVPIQVGSQQPEYQVKSNSVHLPPVDITTYGAKKVAMFDANSNYDLTYKMVLGESFDQKSMEPVFTINDQTASKIPPLQVKTGDRVKVTFENKGTSNHPMHLHGHFFQVLSKNGKAITGSPLIKDTLNIKPQETYEVAFLADNPGEWMFHCHDLHHAAAGMVTELLYQGYPRFVPDQSIQNKGD